MDAIVLAGYDDSYRQPVARVVVRANGRVRVRLVVVGVIGPGSWSITTGDQPINWKVTLPRSEGFGDDLLAPDSVRTRSEMSDGEPHGVLEIEFDGSRSRRTARSRCRTAGLIATTGPAGCRRRHRRSRRRRSPTPTWRWSSSG